LNQGSVLVIAAVTHPLQPESIMLLNHRSQPIPGCFDAGREMSAVRLDRTRLTGLRPVRALTQDEIEEFWRNGVVKLKQVLPPESVDFLRDAFEDIFRHQPEKGAHTYDLTKDAEQAERKGEGSRLLADGGYHEGRSERTKRFMSELNCAR